jgi:hypothetical protein
MTSRPIIAAVLALAALALFALTSGWTLAALRERFQRELRDELQRDRLAGEPELEGL